MATTWVELVQLNGEVELRARFGNARQVARQIFGMPPASPQTAVPVPAPPLAAVEPSATAATQAPVVTPSAGARARPHQEVVEAILAAPADGARTVRNCGSTPG